MSERALHLEIHRMNRIHQELLARNAALESECARLRTVTNHERANARRIKPPNKK
jgi:hypothetical protein